MQALKQAQSRTNQIKSIERTKTPAKDGTAKRNSVKYRKKKYDLYENINSW